MPQTPALMYSDDCAIDYTPAAAVTAGDVVVLNAIVGVAPSDIAANDKGSLQIEGIYKLPKTSAAIVRGLPVFWNASGTPNTGSASSGAANQVGLGVYAGVAVEATAVSTDYAITSINNCCNAELQLAVTAAGSTIADAAQLGYATNVVTGADGTKGVILPVAIPGQRVHIKGVTAGVLKVYPQSGSVINALSASAAYSLTTGAMPITLVANSATQWYTEPLVAS